jgi:hypothetical protein
LAGEDQQLQLLERHRTVEEQPGLGCGALQGGLFEKLNGGDEISRLVASASALDESGREVVCPPWVRGLSAMSCFESFNGPLQAVWILRYQQEG